MALVAGVVLLDMTAGACSPGKEPGIPAAASSAASSVVASSVVASSVVASSAVAPSPSGARPAALPLDSVAPCDLVTDAMRQQFEIDRPDAPSAANPNAPGCTFISSTIGRYVVATVRDKGVAALGRPVEAVVGGFPAVEIRRADIPGVCHLSVDVADGQRLDIEIQRRDRTTPQDQICKDTRTFAEAVLATLRQKLGR